jgi:hypothetical protein
VETVSVIWGNREAKYFRFDGWTGFRVQRFFCPSGKSKFAVRLAKRASSDAGRNSHRLISERAGRDETHHRGWGT